jgi:hypothetical protein
LADPEKLARLAEKLVDLRGTIGEELPNSRERSLALTKLEECEMWLGKALMLMHDNAGARTWLKDHLDKTD